MSSFKIIMGTAIKNKGDDANEKNQWIKEKGALKGRWNEQKVADQEITVCRSSTVQHFFLFHAIVFF